MAALNIPQNGKAIKRRIRKEIPSVDLTAMVDLAFLLITFFMLTTSLAKMSAIDIAKPIDVNPPVFADYPASRTMTILLGKNNKVVYYMGEAIKANMELGTLKMLKQQITANKESIAKKYNHQLNKYMIVIIKPTQTSIYKNFVDVIDEMHVANIKSYAIDDKYITEKEKIFMQSNGL